VRTPLTSCVRLAFPHPALLVAILAAAPLLRAAEPAGRDPGVRPEKKASAGPEETTAPVVLPEYRVTSERVAGLEPRLSREELRQPEPNLGRELMDIPGVFGQSRAADAMEPNIRGLGFDRVTTTLNGIPMFNGSPERTYSPVVLLGPVAVESVTVIKALPSVTLGPATSGGCIALGTESVPTGDQGGAPVSGYVGTTYNGARAGFTTQGLFSARAGAWDGRVTFFRNDLGDYSAPNGKVIAARLDDFGASAAVGWHGDGHEVHAEFLHRRLQLDETVSLPLDGRDSDAEVFTFTDRWHVAAGPLEQLEWRAGYSWTDPFITSAGRPVPTLIFAHASERAGAGGLTSLWRTGGNGTLTAGADFAQQERRAVRTTAAGQDYIWPGAIYQDAGLFAEWQDRLSPAWNLRVGARGDRVWSDARDADKLALGLPIRQQFVIYNGPAAAQVERTDVVGSGNVLLGWTGHGGWSGFAGTGVSAQPAPVTERYRAFLNALGGDGRGGNAVELGNPALRSEVKWEWVAGGSWEGGWCRLTVNLYEDVFRDFILRTPVGTTQPPLARMVVFGYRNIAAELRGGELGATLRPGDHVTVPLTFAVAKGWNRDTGLGLAEMPPWEATAAVRYQQGFQAVQLWAQAGARIVGGKDNPAPLDNPLFTHASGFTVFHLRAGALFSRHLRLEAGVENLFDHLYTEYLTPPVSSLKPASGNLLPGERVPGPGRWVWTSLTWQF